MAKIILSPLFDKLSGVISDTRHYTLYGQSIVASYKPYTKTVTSIKQDNIQKAFTLLMQDYNNLKTNYPMEYESWLEEAKRLSIKLNRRITVIHLYVGYFMQKYHCDLGEEVEPRILTGSEGGYGSSTYGVGKYGSKKTYQTYHYKDRHYRRWLGRVIT